MGRGTDRPRATQDLPVTVHAAQFVSAAAVIASNGNYAIASWKTYLIFMAILTFCTAGNIWGNKILGRWNDAACTCSRLPRAFCVPALTFAVSWSILAVVIISIVVLATSEKTSGAYVFGSFQNSTGWPDGISWILGLLQSALSLIGFDAALHMTEEMPRPSVDAPRAILYAIAVGGVT